MTGKGLAVRTSLSAPPRVPAAEMHTPLAFLLPAVRLLQQGQF